MKEYDVTITITFQARVPGENEEEARLFAWEKLMGNPTRYADESVEEVEEKK